MLREQDEQALRADEDLVEEADEAEPDDGRDVDAAERRDELSGDGEEGLRGRVRQHVGDGRMKRKPSADHRLGRRRVQVQVAWQHPSMAREHWGAARRVGRRVVASLQFLMMSGCRLPGIEASYH